MNSPLAENRDIALEEVFLLNPGLVNSPLAENPDIALEEVIFVKSWTSEQSASRKPRYSARRSNIC